MAVNALALIKALEKQNPLLSFLSISFYVLCRTIHVVADTWPYTHTHNTHVQTLFCVSVNTALRALVLKAVFSIFFYIFDAISSGVNSNLA